MEKGILLAFMLVCYSHQRPSSSNVEVITASSSGSTVGTELTNEQTTTTEGTKKFDLQDKIAGLITETPTEIAASTATVTTVTATAVSVRTFLNVSSSFDPNPVFEDFKPSTYYQPDDGNPMNEKSGPGQFIREVFYEPRQLKKPGGDPEGTTYNRSTPIPKEKNVIVFPHVSATSQEHYFTGELSQLDANNVKSKGPVATPRNPYTFNEVLPQYKPIKHDSGDGDLLPPNFVHHDHKLYDRHFGKQYYGNDMISNSYYSDVIQDGPSKPSYHNSAITVHKKKDPWRSFLSVLATILPVGLLLASFPPTIIKVNATQYPYQFQKNATLYNPMNVISGRYKSLGKKNVAGRNIPDDVDELSGFSDDCLKNKICENMKTNYSPSELDFLLLNDKLNWNRDVSQMTEIAKIAASASPESCRVQFVCNN